MILRADESKTAAARWTQSERDRHAGGRRLSSSHVTFICKRKSI